MRHPAYLLQSAGRRAASSEGVSSEAASSAGISSGRVATSLEALFVGRLKVAAAASIRQSATHFLSRRGMNPVCVCVCPSLVRWRRGSFSPLHLAGLCGHLFARGGHWALAAEPAPQADLLGPQRKRSAAGLELPVRRGKLTPAQRLQLVEPLLQTARRRRLFFRTGT